MRYRLIGLVILVFSCSVLSAADPTPADAVKLLDKLKAKYGGNKKKDKKPEQITHIDLARIKISDSDLKTIATLPAVRNLNIEGPILKELAGKPLYAKDQITDEGLKNLAGMTELRALNLSGTNVTDEGIKHLTGMKNLQELQLSGTKVTDACIETIMKFPNLISVQLNDTKVTDTGIFALKRWKKTLIIGQ